MRRNEWRKGEKKKETCSHENEMPFGLISGDLGEFYSPLEDTVERVNDVNLYHYKYRNVVVNSTREFAGVGL